MKVIVLNPERHLGKCVCVCTCVCMCATCRGRLSTRQQHPKAISSTLVRMKALMALVTFWILLSLLGPLHCLMGHKHAPTGASAL